MKDNKDIQGLIESYLDGSLSEAEKKTLNDWIAQSDDNRLLFERLTSPQYLTDELQKLYSYSEENGWQRVQAHLQKGKISTVTANDNIPGISTFNWRPWLAAACLAGIIFFGITIFSKTRRSESPPVTAVKKDVTAPIVTKAVIQLSNGQTVPLDSINQGMIAQQGNMLVIKNSNGEIIYTGNTDEEIYNTVINPRGSRVVSISLQDGTKVWLNSESSLRYPVAFIGKERKVEIIEGEAYFEVAKDVSRKFIVTGHEVTTEVLGTHFNINTYNDESETRVTLLEGKVKVVKGSSSGTLKPGQQAAFANDNQRLSIVDIDVDKVMAWQTGVFNFEDDDLPAIMRQLSRWYNVEVKFTGNIPSDTYGGVISRDVSLFTVLKILKIGGVKYSLVGKMIIVDNQ